MNTIVQKAINYFMSLSPLVPTANIVGGLTDCVWGRPIVMKCAVTRAPRKLSGDLPTNLKVQIYYTTNEKRKKRSLCLMITKTKCKERTNLKSYFREIR